MSTKKFPSEFDEIPNIQSDDQIIISDTSDTADSKKATVEDAANAYRKLGLIPTTFISASFDIDDSYHNCQHIYATNEDNITATITNNNLGVGAEILITMGGIGAITVAPDDSTVEIQTPDNYDITRRFSQSCLRKTVNGATDIWVFVRYWLATDPIPDAVPPSTPDINTPPGHWSNIPINSWDDNTYIIDSCKPENIKGVVWRFDWNEIETSQASYDWAFVKTQLDNIANYVSGDTDEQASVRATKVNIIIHIKTFSYTNPAPDWLAEAGYTSQHTNQNGWRVHIWEPTASDAFQDLIESIPDNVRDHTNFGGFTNQESAPGTPQEKAWTNKSYIAGEIVYNEYSSGNFRFYMALRSGGSSAIPTHTSGDVWVGGMLWRHLKDDTESSINNYDAGGYHHDKMEEELKNILSKMCEVTPNHHTFFFGNFLTNNIPAIADVSDYVQGLWPDQFVWAGPDLMPGASSVVDYNRLYGFMRERALTPMRFGISSQNHSFELDDPSLNRAQRGHYPWHPEDNSLGMWSIENVFLYGVDELPIEWKFWIHNTGGPAAADDWDPEGLAVVDKYPEFSGKGELIPYADQKDPTLGNPNWTSSNITSFTAISNNADAEECNNVSQSPNQASHALVTSDDTDVAHHFVRYTLSTDRVENQILTGQSYFLQAVVEAGTQSCVRLQIKSAAGGYLTAFYDLTNGTVTSGNGQSSARIQPYTKPDDNNYPDGGKYLGSSDYYACQLWFVLRPNTIVAGDVSFTVSIGDNSSTDTKDYIGSSSSPALNLGRITAKPKTRI